MYNQSNKIEFIIFHLIFRVLGIILAFIAIFLAFIAGFFFIDVFFYQPSLLLIFFVLRSVLIPRDQVFSWKMLENPGTPSLSFCINVSHRVYDDSWIIDSGATDHMTSKSQLFNTYTLNPSNKKIVVANGSLATVAGFGDIYITPTLILKNILHVPKLSANLVSI